MQGDAAAAPSRLLEVQRAAGGAAIEVRTLGLAGAEQVLDLVVGDRPHSTVGVGVVALLEGPGLSGP